MKVIISENESYELRIPETISFSDFDKLVGKLNVVVSMLKGETSAKQISTAPRKYTREEAVHLMKMYNLYGKDGPQFIEALKKIGTTIQRVNSVKHKWIKTWNIAPEEVGLKEYPHHSDYQKEQNTA